ncbi:MAG: FAD-dependent oxidoreductase [Spirochaetota bacterium]
MAGPSVSQQTYAPCNAACPVHTDTRRLVELISRGEYEQAMELLLDANPFSSVCGRICHHPCEQNCRRAKVDAPVGLMKLKRFVMEAASSYRSSRRQGRQIKVKRSEKVAIVGSGPSGMTAARDLARNGFKVVVFESSDTPGGLLGNAIPRYRLPYSVVKEDIDDILSLGVKLQTNYTIGKDCSVDELFDQGYSAVLLATGLSESRTLNIPGIDSRGIMLALPFLRTVLSPGPPAIGTRVLVIGGGNVAIDVARSARRLGAEQVTIACLESRKEMPAWEWEVQETEEEGIGIMNSWGPRSVVSENGEVKGVELKRCTRVFNSSGKFDPRFDESQTTTLECENVILAIGQRGDLTCITGSEVRTGPGQRLECDPQTLSTSRKGLFACGELQMGPASAVESVHDGHRAAAAIEHFIKYGSLLKQPPIELPALGEIPDETAQKIKRTQPVATPVEEPQKRIKDFSEIDSGFTESQALREARRCLACTTGALADEAKCVGCLSCVRICPFGVATVQKTAVMPEEKCQACGLCAAVCPAAAIALKRFGTNQMKDQLEEILVTFKEGVLSKPVIISYCCMFEVTSRSFIKDNSDQIQRSGIYRVMVPCVARLSVLDILAPFELGAEGVVIIACREGSCLYPTAEQRLLSRIRRAKGLLEEIHMEPERIDYWKTQGSAEVSWSSFWEISRRKLDQIITRAGTSV